MKQKEHEYQQSKNLNNLDLSSINKVAKSSSGNSSLSSSSNSLTNENYHHNIINSQLQANRAHGSPNRRRQVTFETSKSRPRSTSKTKTNRGLPVHTVTNELKNIRNNVENLCEVEEDRVAFLLKSVYNEDLKDAETIMKESLVKVKNRSDLTNELYLNAFRCYDEEDGKLMRPR